MEEAYPDMIRISIHAHTNAGPKFGICLIPGQDLCNTPHTPWHNVIVETSCGQTHIMRRERVDLFKFEVYEHPVYNRPWGFKEKVNIAESRLHKVPDNYVSKLVVAYYFQR